MLFTDGTILTIQDLREHDNFVLDVASTESIELSSKLAIAQREMGYDLTAFLMTRGMPPDLSRIVITSELRDALATQTMALIYRDAYNTHLNDRYLGRWKEFARAAERGLLRLLRNGIGIAGFSVPRASAPLVTTSSTGGLETGVYHVQIAWQHIAGNVSEKSSAVLVDCESGSVIVDAGPPRADMAGWHAFLGVEEDRVTRQNETPIASGTVWTQAAGLRHDLAGPEASGPDYYVRNSGQLLRG